MTRRYAANGIPSWEEYRTVVHETEEYWKRVEDVEAYLQEDGRSIDEAPDIVDDEYGDLYGEVHYLMTEGLQGADCWREMRLEADTDPVMLQHVGRYWSYRRRGIGHYQGAGYELRQPTTVVYRARIDLTYVDYEKTFGVHAKFADHEELYEISFLPDAPIYVYDVTLEDGTVVEINDWRRT